MSIWPLTLKEQQITTTDANYKVELVEDRINRKNNFIFSYEVKIWKWKKSKSLIKRIFFDKKPKFEVRWLRCFNDKDDANSFYNWIKEFIRGEAR